MGQVPHNRVAGAQKSGIGRECGRKEVGMVRVYYLLSEKGRKQSLLKGGNGWWLQCHEVAEPDPELIELATVAKTGDAFLCVGFRASIEQLHPVERANLELNAYPVPVDIVVEETSREPGYVIKTVDKVVEFDDVMTVEELLAWEKRRREYLSQREIEAKKEAEPLALKYEAERKRLEEEAALREKEAQRRREEEEAARKKWEQEKLQWIKKHGSEYLRQAVELGYDCQRRYVEERAAMEFPGYIVDFDDHARWKSRSCPSEEALAEVKELLDRGLDAEVVWLLQHPLPDEDEFFTPCEAIVVKGYLGRYDLIKVLGGSAC